MRKLPLVIFDLDGTLFRTETVDIAAINKALVSNGFKSKSDDEILSVIGLTMPDACKVLLGEVSRSRVEQFTNDVIRFENEEILKHGLLYDGVLEFLRRMKSKGFSMCICTNGNIEYVEPIIKKFNLDEFFVEIWHQRDGITKSQAVGILKSKFGAEWFIMVGDRSSDIEAARENGGASIGAEYGFGKDEVLQADYVADSIGEVEKIVLKLSEK